MGTVIRMALMWAFMTWMKQGKQPPPPPSGGANVPDTSAHYTNAKFIKGTLLDAYAFLMESPYTSRYDISDLVWSETGYELGGAATRQYSFTYEPSEVSCTVLAPMHGVLNGAPLSLGFHQKHA